MPTTKYIKSNIESAINRFENDFVNVAARRFPTKTLILKMLPIMPMNETEMNAKIIILPFVSINEMCRLIRRIF